MEINLSSLNLYSETKNQDTVINHKRKLNWPEHKRDRKKKRSGRGLLRPQMILNVII